MGVRFACHACGKPLHVKDELAGKRGICPSCQARIWIPHDDAETSSRSREQSPAAAQAARSPEAERSPEATRSPEGGARRQVASEQDESAKPAAMQGILESEPEAVWYVRPPSGGQYGPASSELLGQWIEEQRVAAAALLWREGWPQWRVARDALPEFADRLPAGEDEGESAVGRVAEPSAEGVTSTGSEESGQHGRAAQRGQTDDQTGARLKGRWDLGATRRVRLTRRMVTVAVLLAVSVLLVGLLVFVALQQTVAPDTIQ